MSDTQVQSEQPTSDDTHGKLGSLLKEYREQSGHNIYEVAEALCLSPEIVTSLEEEDFDSLPEPPYVRGYLRSYAKFAEIDPKEIISLYEKQRGADPRDLEYHFKPSGNGNLPKPPISPTALRLGLLALLLVVLASLSMIPAVNNWIGETWAGFSQQTAQKNFANNSTELLTTDIPPLPDDIVPLELDKEEKKDDESITLAAKGDDKTALKEENSSDKEKSNKDSKNTNKDNPDKSKNDKKDNKEADKANSDKNKTSKDKEAESKKDETKKQVAEGDTKLKFVFKSEVWMRIKDKNKKTVFESLSPAGEEKEIKLNKPMTFRIGNAGGVEIFVEGKRLDIKQFTKGSVANFTIE